MVFVTSIGVSYCHSSATNSQSEIHVDSSIQTPIGLNNRLLRFSIHKDANIRKHVDLLCESRKIKDEFLLLDVIGNQNPQFYSDTCFYLLKACANVQSLVDGKQLHSHIIKSGCQTNRRLSNAIINMYAKCGSLVEARRVFNELIKRDIFTWTTMISAYAEDEDVTEVQRLFNQMQCSGLIPDRVTYATILRACASAGALSWGKQIHDHVIKAGLEPDVRIGNALINMYIKCESKVDACQVFDRMLLPDVITWTTLILGYSEYGDSNEAIKLFGVMQLHGLQPNKITFVNVAIACAREGALNWAKHIHAHLIRSGLDLHDVIVRNAILTMYSKCGSVQSLFEAFGRMPVKNVISWNVLISGCIQFGFAKEAVYLFRKMQEDGLIPNKITYINIVNACIDMRNLTWGKYMHAHLKGAYLESNILVGSCLIDMYAKCGCISYAFELFKILPASDVVLCTAMISGYAASDNIHKALELFWCMQGHGVEPDKVTYAAVLVMCADAGVKEWGTFIHARVIKSGQGGDTFLSNTLIEMYIRCKDIGNASKVFDGMIKWDVVSCTAMVSGLSEYGDMKESVRLFVKMQQHGVRPNRLTYVTILGICASVGALECGKHLHVHLKHAGLTSDMHVDSALVDMYGKCGNIQEAREVFNRMHARNLITWTTMISAYAQYGDSNEAISLFKQMQLFLRPNKITFASVFTACKYAGLIDVVYHLLFFMVADSGVELGSEHFVCMIDLLGHAGHLYEAKDLLETMPFCPDTLVWTAFLSSCKPSF